VRFFNLTIAAIILAVVHARAEVVTRDDNATNTPPAVVEEHAEKKWEFGVDYYAYVVPHDSDYLQPTITADRGWLHLEARYNYENRETASAWVGYNFSGGKTVTWEFTPMLGGVFGKSYGVAPGYKGSIHWWKLELYSEGEYYIDSHITSEHYFYNWSELTLAPVEWFRFGLATQRTRTYHSDRDIQRGVLAGFSYKELGVTGYVMNPDESKPTVIVSVGVTF
jgi:hypothetical protein